MRVSYWAVLLTAGAVLSGCATLSEEECLVADWHSIGYTDAANGNTTSRVESHRKACSKHGVSVNLDEYLAGYEDGLPQFCNRNVGYTRGKSGYSYSGICPSYLEDDFLDGYVVGREIYELSQQAGSLSNQLNSQQQRIYELEQSIQAKTGVMLSDQSDAATRYQLHSEIQAMEDEIKTLELSNHDLTPQIEALNEKINTLQASYLY